MQRLQPGPGSRRRLATKAGLRLQTNRLPRLLIPGSSRASRITDAGVPSHLAGAFRPFSQQNQKSAKLIGARARALMNIPGQGVILAMIYAQRGQLAQKNPSRNAAASSEMPPILFVA